jgi:hypothetical protein
LNITELLAYIFLFAEAIETFALAVHPDKEKSADD